MEIKNLTALVTGAASGMGAAVAKHLANQGAKLILVDLDENLQDIAQTLNAYAIQDDVSSGTLDKPFEPAFKAQGIPRILVNCAGIAPAQRIVGRDGAQPLSEFERVIQVNLIGSFNVMRLAAQAMMSLEMDSTQTSRGVIIHTASIAAFEGQVGQAAYSASKGGVVSMILPAAREFAQFGIRVNAIAPGLIKTPMILNMPQSIQTALSETVPYPKRLGEPEEFAKLVAHIIDNELLNGEIIRLDGALRLSAS